MDSYDQWKMETPEEEDERMFGAARRREARQQYLADHEEDQFGYDWKKQHEKGEEHDGKV
jgi:hypothetical protein